MTNEEYRAKKKLTQLQYLDESIQSNIRELERLRALSMSIGGSDFKEKVKGGVIESRMAKQIAEIVDLENDIKKEIGEYTDLRNSLKAAIESQENEHERLLLKLRYIENLTWEEVAEKMNLTPRHVYRLHKTALGNFKFNKK